MKKQSLLFLICFCPLILTGQGKTIEYYKQEAQLSNSPDKRLIALDTLLSKTIHNDKDAYIRYSKEYIGLALDLDSVDLAAKKAMNVQHPLTTYGNDPLQAITLINNVIVRKYKLKDSLLLGNLYVKRGRAKTRINLKSAVSDYNTALNTIPKKDSLQRADVYLFRGQAYSSLGNFVLAIDDFNTAYNIYETHKVYDYMMFSKQGIINMFSMNGFYNKAKAERDILIDKMKSLKLLSYIPNEHYNQALDYKKMGLRSKEYQAILDAQKSWKDYNEDTSLFIRIHSLLVEYYAEDYELEQAKKELLVIENRNYDFSKDPYTHLNYLAAKISFLKASAEFETALKYAQQKLKVAKDLGMESEIMISYSQLSQIYYDLGSYKTSIDYNSLSTTIKDSIYNRTAINALAYYQSLYEIEKEQKEFAEHKAEIALLKKHAENFKKIIISSGVFVLFTFILALLYRNQRYLKNKKILQERFSQELLFSQEDERRRIAKDLHDGIGQQLLVIKNKLNKNAEEDTKKLVNLAIEEVRLISRDLHPFQLQELGLTKAIENTINLVDENTSLFISAEIDNIDNIFSKEDEVNIYRIIQESLSNIIKHAQAEAGKVSVQKLTNSLLISVRDNGVGFDFTEKYQDSKSLGLKILLERTRFLKGQMKVTSKKNAGTVLEFDFPL